MFDKQEYIDRIKDVMTKEHLTYSDVHRDMEMAYTTVQKILNPANPANWSSKTIRKVKEFLYKWENQ